jgi:hypothetical protein
MPPEEKIVMRDYYSIAEQLVSSGFPVQGAFMAISSIEETLEGVDVNGFKKAMEECLPLVENIKAGNGYQKVLMRVYDIISPVKGVGPSGAEIIVRLFTPNGKDKIYRSDIYPEI